MRAALAVLLLHVDGALTRMRSCVRETFASGFTQPVAFVQDPTDRSVQFVVEQRGRIRAVRNGAIQSPDFLDLQSAIASGGERGLLGLAFAPDYGISGRFYVNFTNLAGAYRRRAVPRSSNPLVADAVVTLRSSMERHRRHRRSSSSHSRTTTAAISPSVRTAFSTSGWATAGRGTIRSTARRIATELLGKMLRVDVNVPDSHPIGYVIPAGNPFAGGGARAEIWSFGLAQSVALQLRRRGEGRNRRDGHRGRRAEPRGRKSTTSRAVAAAATTAGATAKARTTT